jgi:hypothetical protein
MILSVTGLKRCGKSCRLRWLNYLRPDIKHGGFTEEEDNIICALYSQMGSRQVLVYFVSYFWSMLYSILHNYCTLFFFFLLYGICLYLACNHLILNYQLIISSNLCLVVDGPSLLLNCLEEPIMM